MINILETTILVLLFLVIYLVFLKPFVPLLILKLKLGDKAILMFSPILGFNAFADDSTKRKQDFMFAFNHELRKNPKAVVILTNILHKPFLLITGPEHIKDMYTDHHSYVKLDPFNIQNFMEKGLVMSEGDDWKRQRRFLGTAFTFEKLKARIPMINEVVNKISDTDQKNNLNYFTSKITGEVVIQSFFGKLAQGLQFNGQDAQVALVELLNEVYVLPMKNPYVLFKQMIFGFESWNILPIKSEKQMIAKVETFKKIVKELIIKRIEELKLNPIKEQENMVFLDIYVTEYLKEQSSQNKTIDIDEIIHQFITLFFAGTDTTATLSSLCLYYLAQFPEIQNDILQEVLQVVGNGVITEQHLNKFEKINAFIQEVLRIRNPALINLVRYVRNDKQLLDIKLSQGWYISAYHNAGSQLDKHFDNPEEFDYKRWLTNKSIIKQDNGYIHIPFAAGQRNCIGQHMAMLEAKMILAILVRKFQIQLNPAVKQIRFGLRFLYCVEPDNCLIFEPRK